MHGDATRGGPIARDFVIAAVAMLLLGSPCFAAKPITDVQAAKRVEEAKQLLAKGRLDRAASKLNSLVQTRPDFAPALLLLCEARTAQAGLFGLQPLKADVIRAHFKTASIACSQAAAVENPPNVTAHRAWAFDALVAGPDSDRISAYQAWVGVEPTEPTAFGVLAAMLDDAGRAEEADLLLARAAATSMAVGHRARFAFVCQRWKSRDRVRPMIVALEAADSSPQGRAMVDVLRAYAEEGGERAGPLSFLGRIEDGTLDDAAARKLWGCLGGELAFLTPTAGENTPGPCETLPARRSFGAPDYPDNERRNRREGKVLVFLRINADGTTGVNWIAGATSPAFAAAAAEFVKRRRYTPATCSGVPIPFPATFQVEFRLK